MATMDVGLGWARSVLTAIALAPLLTACTDAVILRHPDGRMVKCGPYDARALTTGQREAQCISDYQRQGFERAPE